MIKEDLSIDNVIKILEKKKYNYKDLQYPYGMTPFTYNAIIKILLNNFFDYKINKLEIDDELYTLNNVVNKNGHIYPKEVFDKAIGEYLKKENIKNRKLKLEKILKNLNEKI